LPLVVFVTAFNQFALQAFEVHAVDYLLKPFDRERFDKCLNHVRQRLRKRSQDSVDDRIAALLAQIKSPQRSLDRLVFKTDGKVIFIRPDEIDYVESDGNYVNVRAGQVTHYLRETLSFFEEQLPSGQFIRISRSGIVNLERVKEMQSLFYGDFAVILRDGSRLTMSRSYRDRLDSLQHRSRSDSNHE